MNNHYGLRGDTNDVKLRRGSSERMGEREVEGLKVWGGGLRLSSTMCGEAESSSGRGCLGRFVAHEMVRES